MCEWGCLWVAQNALKRAAENRKSRERQPLLRVNRQKILESSEEIPLIAQVKQS